MTQDAIVVGGGIAGLVAAHQLARANLHVTLLEANDRLGGRFRTEQFAGQPVDVGAQFVGSAYTTLLPIIERLGLGSALRPMSPWSAMARDQRMLRFRIDRPWTMLRSGLFQPITLLRLTRHVVLPRLLGSLPMNDCLGWSAFDDEDAETWCLRSLGRRALEDLIEPLLAGMCFQQPRGTSKVVALMILQFLSHGRRTRLFTLEGGFSTLCRALVKDVEVRLGNRVDGIRTHRDSVEVTSGGETLRGRRVIVATTATTAAKLFAAVTETERRLLEAQYRSSLTVTLSVDSSWSGSAGLQGVYGLMIPKAERRWIASVGAESAKGALPEGGDLLHLFIDSVTAPTLLALSDAEIANRVLAEMEGHLPGISRSVRSVSVFRWPEADPEWPVGRMRAIAQYRRSWSCDRPVLFAGDFAGLPFNDGAAESASWAADRAIDSLVE